MDSGCRVCGNKLVGGQLSSAVGGPRAFGHLSRQRATAADNVRPSCFMFVHHAAKKRCRRGQGGRGEEGSHSRQVLVENVSKTSLT